MGSSTEDWRTSYTTICRLCMQRDGFMLGIFNHIQGKEKSIYKKIMDCTALEISFGDGLPNSICHRCLYKIEFCLEFRQQCFVSDATLRQISGVTKQMQNSTQYLNPFAKLPETPEGDVVMVVDPNTLDYDSEYESDANGTEHHSDNEANDLYEFRNVFMCKFCDRAFTDKTECGLHESNSHNNTVPYTCSLCEMNFGDRLQYSAHLKSVHQNDKPYNCPQCERTFARRSDLRKHTIVHTGIKPFTCHICFKSFSRNTNLSKHIRIHNGQKPFVCPSCPKTFISKIELTRHAVTHSGVKPFKCNYCHLSFGRKDKFQRHQKKHFPQENAEDKTQELRMLRENLATEYGYINQDSNENNIDNVKEEKADWPSTENMVINIDPFNNEQVEQISMEPDISISEHIDGPECSDKLGENSLPQVPEHITGDSFTQEAENGLLDPSEKVKRYPCQMCNKRFSSFEGLHLHMGIHTGERPFSCSICTKAFMRKRELDRHMATHTGMKPFKCTSCEKRFGRKDKLLRHMRIHDVNKEHICFICGASFNRKDGLSHHMRTHMNDDTLYSSQAINI